MHKAPSSARLSAHNVAGTNQSQPQVIPKTSNFWFDSNKGTRSSNKDNTANTVNNGIKRTRKSDNLDTKPPCLEDLSKPASDSPLLVAIDELLGQCKLSDITGYGYYVDPSACDAPSNSKHGKSSPLSDETEGYTSDSDDAEKKCLTMNRSLSIGKNSNSTIASGFALGGVQGSGHKMTLECSGSSDECHSTSSEEDDAMFFPMDGI